MGCHAVCFWRRGRMVCCDKSTICRLDPMTWAETDGTISDDYNITKYRGEKERHISRYFCVCCGFIFFRLLLSPTWDTDSIFLVIGLMRNVQWVCDLLLLKFCQNWWIWDGCWSCLFLTRFFVMKKKCSSHCVVIMSPRNINLTEAWGQNVMVSYLCVWRYQILYLQITRMAKTPDSVQVPNLIHSHISQQYRWPETEMCSEFEKKQP